MREEFQAGSGRAGVRELRRRYGIPEDRRAALLVAGSWGVGGVGRTARELAETGVVVPVVVCGRNEALRTRLTRRGVGVPLGWVDDMANLMRACDVLIQNAGGLTSVEAFAVGLPVVSYRCLPGHGRTNAEAMAEAGVAVHACRSGPLTHILEQLGPQACARLTESASRLFTTDPAGLINASMSRPAVTGYPRFLAARSPGRQYRSLLSPGLALSPSHWQCAARPGSSGWYARGLPESLVDHARSRLRRGRPTGREAPVGSAHGRAVRERRRHEVRGRRRAERRRRMSGGQRVLRRCDRAPDVRETPGITVAFAAGMLFGLASALQHAAAGRVERHQVLDPRLLVRLLGDRLWLLGGICDAAASVLQAWAARLIPVTLAQPVLVLGLPFAVVFRNVLARRLPPWRDIATCLVCASAVALFVVLTQPYGSARVPDAAGLATLAVALAAATVLALSARHTRRPALLTAVAGGVVLGVAAVLLRAVVGGWHAHPDARWYLAAVLLLLAGGLALLTTQSAFQHGPLPAPLAVLTLLEPVTATLAAVTVLGEHLQFGGPRLPLTAAALLVGVAAVIDLAHSEAAQHAASVRASNVTR